MEIKIRAWDTIAKQMIDWNTITQTAFNREGELGLMYRILTYPINQDTIIPLLYTGLKDKSGKEIYEGDIYIAERGYMPSRGYKSKKHPNRIKVYCVVEWDKREAKWWDKEIKALPEFQKADKEAPYHYYYTSFYGNDKGICKNIEVVGNIYENQNILK